MEQQSQPSLPGDTPLNTRVNTESAVRHFFSTITLQKLLKQLSSLNLTVMALFMLFLLTLLGTFYQVEHGLYAAQQRFFYSWGFLLFGFIPFLGAKTVLGVMTVNLLASSLVRYKFEPKKYGILLIHYGLSFFLVASFIAHYFVREAYVALNEGESTGAAYDHYESEIALWAETTNASGQIERSMATFAAAAIVPGQPIELRVPGHDEMIRLVPKYYYPHARPASFGEADVKSVSGLTALVYAPPPKKREQTFPGALFTLETDYPLNVDNEKNNPLQAARDDVFSAKLLLWEADPIPYVLTMPEATLYLRLQRKQYPLPFIVKLNDFIKEDYYGTKQAKNYESHVELLRGDVLQESRIYMNNPLRTDYYTFFQASFAQDAQGNERSIFAVVYNTGYWVPYVASLVIVLGLCVHFIVMFVIRIRQTAIQQRGATAM